MGRKDNQVKIQIERNDNEALNANKISIGEVWPTIVNIIYVKDDLFICFNKQKYLIMVMISITPEFHQFNNVFDGHRSFFVSLSSIVSSRDSRSHCLPAALTPWFPTTFHTYDSPDNNHTYCYPAWFQTSHGMSQTCTHHGLPYLDITGRMLPSYIWL